MIFPPAIPGMTRVETAQAWFDAWNNGHATRLYVICKDTNDGYVFLDSESNDFVMEDAMTKTTVLNPDEDIQFGNVVSAELKLRIYKSWKTDIIDWSKQVDIEFFVEINGTFVAAMVGRFFGSEPKKITLNDVDVLEFVAYDIVNNLNTKADDFIESLTFPMTVTDIEDALCNDPNNPLTQFESLCVNDNMQIDSNPFKKNMTYREILSVMAEFCGSNAFATFDTIRFIRSSRPWSTVFTITPDDYFQISLSDYSIGTIPAVQYIDTQDETNNESYPSTYTGIPYKIINNPIFNCLSAANKTAALLNLRQGQFVFKDDSHPNAIEYRPMTVATMGCPIVEVGDIIDVVDQNGITHPIHIFAHTFVWGNGYRSIYECTGNPQRQDVSESEKEQYYLDGRYVGKDQLGDAAECDVYNDLDETSAGKVLDARQGKALDDRIARVTTVRSLVTPKNATSAATSISTYDGRKFSDHHTLVFILRDNASSSTIRNAITIPASIWKSGQMLYLIQNHGTNLENRSGITFAYESDTSIKVVTNGSAALTGFEIIGYFNPT